MDHSIKVIIRELFYKNSMTSRIYEYLSWIKIKMNENLSDEEYIKKNYKENTGKELNLDTPRTFNEKLQWLKLYDRNSMYTKMVDKYLVKNYVSKIIGDKYIIPIIGGPWYEVEDIDLNLLPDSFVLKCNHDCGSVFVCKCKKNFNFESVKEKIRNNLSRNYYLKNREWPYKNVTPCVFAEKYMAGDSGGDFKDYKFFCFNGKAKYMFIASDRMNIGTETKFDFFDMDFNHLPFTNGHANAPIRPEKPHCFDEMKKLAEKLSIGIPHVRVDFYEVNRHAFFGEFTFYHWGGNMNFVPEDWDKIFGDNIDLSLVNDEYKEKMNRRALEYQ